MKVQNGLITKYIFLTRVIEDSEVHGYGEPPVLTKDRTFQFSSLAVKALNVLSILEVKDRGSPANSRITVNHASYTVKETPEEIIKLIQGDKNEY